MESAFAFWLSSIRLDVSMLSCPEYKGLIISLVYGGLNGEAEEGSKILFLGDTNYVNGRCLAFFIFFLLVKTMFATCNSLFWNNYTLFILTAGSFRTFFFLSNLSLTSLGFEVDCCPNLVLEGSLMTILFNPLWILAALIEDSWSDNSEVFSIFRNF